MTKKLKSWLEISEFVKYKFIRKFIGGVWENHNVYKNPNFWVKFDSRKCYLLTEHTLNNREEYL